MATNIIKINRGDYLSFSMSIEDENHPTGFYNLQPNDILYFALLNPHDKFEDAIILRGYTFDDAIVVDTKLGTIHMFNIELNRADTLALEPGVYYYTFKLLKNATSIDIGFTDPNAKLSTVIERTKFIVNE